MMHAKKLVVLLALAIMMAQAKPSVPFGFQHIPDHIDLAPPILPPPGHLLDQGYIHTPLELQAPWPATLPFHHAPTAPHQHLLPQPLLPFHHAPEAHQHLLPPPPLSAPVFHAPTQVLNAPASVFHTSTPVLHQHLTPFAPFASVAPVAPVAPLLPAPTPIVHTEFLPAPAPLLPSPLPVADIHPPVFEAIPFATPIPSYRAIPGPKTTTHHVSVGYAFPHAHIGAPHSHHLHSLPHAHLRAAPLDFGHHHHHHSIF